MNDRHETQVEAVQGLGTAAWFALVTSLVELVVLVSAWELFRTWNGLDIQAFWMNPLTNVVIFAVVALPALALRRFAPRLAGPAALAGLLAFVGSALVLTLFRWLATYAKLILALGLAVHVGRTVGNRPEGFRRLVRRTLPVLAAGFLVLAAGLNGWSWARGRMAVTGLPEARAGAPNIILLILDTVRAESLSLYGRERLTSPNLDRWSREGTVFQAPYATAPWTLPSHATLFTGRYPTELSTGWYTPLDDAEPTLAEVLADAGYLTAGFVANLYYAVSQTGLDRGFAHYEDYRVSPGQILLSSAFGRKLVRNNRVRQLVGFYDNVNRKSAADVNREFFRWLSKQDPGRPFFAFLNYFDAHEPYVPVDPYRNRFGSAGDRDWSRIRINKRIGAGYMIDRPTMTDAQNAAELDAYEEILLYLDDQFQALLDGLEERGDLANTLVVVTSDHGEMFGERGVYGHGTSLLRPELRVPLVMSLPGVVPAGLVFEDRVTLRDLPATLAALAGIPGQQLPGVPLSRVWDSDADGILPGSPVMAHLAPKEEEWAPPEQWSLLSGDLQIIRSVDGRMMLFDLSPGGDAFEDLASDPAYRGRAEALAGELERLLSGR